MFRNSSTSLSFMAQLARAVVWSRRLVAADKRVLYDLRGAQTAMVSVRAFLLFAVSCLKLSGHWSVLLVNVSTEPLSHPCCPPCSD